MPEFVGEFDAEGDVAEHFAVNADVLGEAAFGVVVFPKFAAVVEEDAGGDEVAVEFRIDSADGGGGAHHLGDVFDESAAAGVVVFLGGGGAAEAVFELGDEGITEAFEPRVADFGEHADDVGPVFVLAFAGGGVAGEEFGFFGFVEGAEGPTAAVDAVLVLGPFSFEAEGGAKGEGLGGFELAVVAPDFQGEGGGGVGEGEFEVGVAFFGGFFDAGLELGVDGGGRGGVASLLFEIENGHGRAGW